MRLVTQWKITYVQDVEARCYPKDIVIAAVNVISISNYEKTAICGSFLLS